MDQASATGATLLFVDDEPSILSALRRVCRPQGYRVLTAGSGAEALAVLGSEPVDLIVSDMRMPQMDGAQLLQAVRERWPEVVRVLLTGYADIGSTIAAINQGEIHRYIAKPWDDQELLLCLREGLERRRLRAENDRLHRLAAEQNLALQAANSGLEQRVAARTAELQQVNDMLGKAYEQLQQNFMLSLQVFASLLELRDGSSPGYSERVGQLARSLAVELRLGPSEELACYAAGLLHEVGKIGLPDALLRKPVSAMRDDELQRYRRYPLNGEAALMPLVELRAAARLVRAHQERLDGRGFPDGLAGRELPLAAQVVGLACTYEALQAGRLSERQHDPAQAREAIRRSRGSHFEPALVDAFEALMARGPQRVIAEQTLDASELKPGMVMARDLRSPQGTLLLAKGFTFDAAVIRTIRELVVRESLAIAFHIRAGERAPAATPLPAPAPTPAA
jgi:response regulator RpfG family c-di-GMP phosphodiesterase